MKMFPKVAVKDRKMVAFPQTLEDYGREESEEESEDNDTEVQVVGVKQEGQRARIQPLILTGLAAMKNESPKTSANQNKV